MKKTTSPNTMTGHLATVCATRLMPLMLLVTLPAVARADFTYTTNNNTITITGYSPSCPGGAIIISNEINGLPVTSIGSNAFYSCCCVTSLTIGTNVTSIGDYAFYFCTSLTNLTIPNGVTSIGDYAFFFCHSLTSDLTIPNSVVSIGDSAFINCDLVTNLVIGTNVTSIGDHAFDTCTNVPSVTIPNSVTNIGNSAFSECGSVTNLVIGTGVTSIGDEAFYYCLRLTSVTIPSSVASIGDGAFSQCFGMTSVYFTGNAPAADSTVFTNDNKATAYYLPGTTGWYTPFGGIPAVLWNPQAQNLGVQTNQFGFTITGPINLVIVVEACTNLVNPVWVPLATNTLTGGSSHFSDAQSTNYPARYYHLRSP